MRGFQPIKDFFTSVTHPKTNRREASQPSSRVTRSASPNRRLSIFNLRGLGSSSKSKPKKREDVETAENVVQQQSDRRKRKVTRLDELKQQLEKDRDNLNKEISRFNERAARRITRLEDLKAQDDKEKWEDELFETRLKELQSARAVIDTRSTASGADVQRQIEELNRDIAAIAALAAETRTRDARQVSLDGVKDYLGEGFLPVFQGPRNVEDDKELLQTILQVFLVRSCAEFINSWHIDNPALSTHLDRLYDRIRNKEEQMVAGKWRQITFAQLPHGPDTELLRQCASVTAAGLLKIASCAGRGGDAQEIQRRSLQLLEKAEGIRINARAGILSADLRPFAAAYGERYAPSWMDASHTPGMEQIDLKRCRVLGSLTLGLKVRKSREDVDPDLENLESKTYVLFIESFPTSAHLTSH